MSYQSEVKLYKKAVDALIALGLKTTDGFLLNTEKGMKQALKGWLRDVQIDPLTKRILTTDQNFALTAKLIADVEGQLDMSFVKPGRDWITDVKERAYFAGQKYQGQLLKGGSLDDAVILQGIDANTLRGIQEATYGQIRGFSTDQVEYLRRTLTESVLHKKTWPQTADRLIHDGKIPALVVEDKNGVKRFVEMRTRVENMVRTETSRIAEQGSQDKAEEIFGDNLGGRWHSLPDARPHHLARNNMVRTAEEWRSKPGPDGKVIAPGEEVNCRCMMEWGDYDTLIGEKAAEEAAGPPPEPEPTPTPPPRKKPPTAKKKPPAPPPLPTPKLPEFFLNPSNRKAGETLVEFTARSEKAWKTQTAYSKKWNVELVDSHWTTPEQLQEFNRWHRALPKHIQEELRDKANLRAVGSDPGSWTGNIAQDPYLKKRFLEEVKINGPARTEKRLKLPQGTLRGKGDELKKAVDQAVEDRFSTVLGMYSDRVDTITGKFPVYVNTRTQVYRGTSVLHHETGHYVDFKIWRQWPDMTHVPSPISPDRRFIKILKAFELDNRGELNFMKTWTPGADGYGASLFVPTEVFAESSAVFHVSAAANDKLLANMPELWALIKRMDTFDRGKYTDLAALFKGLRAEATKEAEKRGIVLIDPKGLKLLKKKYNIPPFQYTQEQLKDFAKMSDETLKKFAKTAGWESGT